MSAVEIIAALAILLGLVGIVFPVLPGGSLLIGAAVLGWAIWLGRSDGWVVFAIAAVLLLAGIATKYLVPGRRLHQLGIPWRTQLAGALAAVVGFFVIPVLGFFLGFVLGVYVAELVRVGRTEAWGSTVHAVKAAGLAILIELAAALLATGAWAIGLVVT